MRHLQEGQVGVNRVSEAPCRTQCGNLQEKGRGGE